MERQRIQNLFFGGLFLVLFLAVVRIFSPFFTVILWSMLLYVLFNPFYHRLTGNLHNGRKHRVIRMVLAGVFSIGSVVLIVVPLLFVIIQLARQLTLLIVSTLQFLESNPELIDEVTTKLANFVRNTSLGSIELDGGELRAQLTGLLRGRADAFVSLGTGAVRNIGKFAIGLLFMTFTLYFFYVDGTYLLSLFGRAVPIRTEYMKELVQKFSEITRNLFLGYILVALFQAVVAFLIFSLFSVRESVLFAVLLMFTSFIPMIGAGTVWLPVGVARILTGDLLGGVAFLLLCAVFISSLDNFLRPFFLKDRIKLHPLIIFFSILGGVTLFGFNGLVLGPLMVIFFLTVLDLFLIEHGISPER